jgi:hypothetical protein
VGYTETKCTRPPQLHDRSYCGLLGAFVGVLAVPSRRIPQLAIHELPVLELLILVLLGTAALTVIGIAQLCKTQTVPIT